MTRAVVRRTHALGPVLAWALCLIAGAALAQAAPAPAPGSTTVGEVVVHGVPPATSKAFETAVSKFVHDLGRPGPIGQISRWRRPLCPLTLGLSQGFDDFVTKRIREVAARVGAPGAGDCRGEVNVLVAFTTDPDALMTDVRKHHEGLLGYHFVGQTRSLAAFEPPMKSWYVTLTTMPGTDFVMVDQAYAQGPPGGASSHIPPEYRSQFAFVLVVIDARLLEGQAIGPVADRVAMLSLSKPAPRDGCSALPSILDLLDPKCPSGSSMQGLTSYDEAYLKGLYGYEGSEVRYFERQAISKGIAKDGPPNPQEPRGR